MGDFSVNSSDEKRKMKEDETCAVRMLLAEGIIPASVYILSPKSDEQQFEDYIKMLALSFYKNFHPKPVDIPR